MLKVRDLKKLLEDVPDDTEVVCIDSQGWANPVKHADLVTRGIAVDAKVVLCPMGSHLPADAISLRTANSLPKKKMA